jgi:hypothetical protein
VACAQKGVRGCVRVCVCVCVCVCTHAPTGAKGQHKGGGTQTYCTDGPAEAELVPAPAPMTPSGSVSQSTPTVSASVSTAGVASASAADTVYGGGGGVRRSKDTQQQPSMRSTGSYWHGLCVCDMAGVDTGGRTRGSRGTWHCSGGGVLVASPHLLLKHREGTGQVHQLPHQLLVPNLHHELTAL